MGQLGGFMAGWLPLFEYSNKYRVSISTLRRRIKSDSIDFKLDDGKYLILDTPPDKMNRAKASEEIHEQDFIETVPEQKLSQMGEPAVFSTANRLLDELKRAYTLILQEKDEQIRLLREEISDLKTLVRVLEPYANLDRK